MAAKRAYMDHNATAPVRPEAAEAVTRALRFAGNPSSVHAEGRAARRLVEEARAEVAALIHARPAEVIFTSSGTEAANLAFHAARTALGIERAVVSAVEHDCVHAVAAALDLPVTVLPVNPDGVADLAALAAALGGGGRTLVALMLANNETGVVQPVAEAVRLAGEVGAYVAVDAVQAAGKMPVDFAALGADMMFLSAHKIGGPQGAGALVMREGLAFAPLIRGGGQELRRRAGTENAPGIAGFGVAAALAVRETGAEAARLLALRERLEARIAEAAPDAVFFGSGAPRLANTSCFSAFSLAEAGVEAETLVMALDLDGIAVSAGAACSSGKVARSHVLAAMGVGEALARSAIRVSLGAGSSEEDIDRLVASWTRICERAARRRSALAAGMHTKAENGAQARAGLAKAES